MRATVWPHQAETAGGGREGRCNLASALLPLPLTLLRSGERRPGGYSLVRRCPSLQCLDIVRVDLECYA